MQFLFDNLLSVLISGAIVLILAAASLTSSRSARDATGYYAARARTRTVVTALEADLPNIGNEVPAATAAFTAYTSTASLKVLEFRGLTAGATAVQRVRYEAVPTTDASCLSASACWALSRTAYTDGGAATTAQRIGTVGAFDVTLLPMGATTVTATALDVRVVLFPPPGAGGSVAQQTFAKRYRLANLALRATT
jgi:hypothetical protein